MPRRNFYIASYDIRQPKRLVQTLAIMKGYASGRQKSVFECFLSAHEKRTMLQEIENTICVDEGDRFLLLQIDKCSEHVALGKGVIVDDEETIYIS